MCTPAWVRACVRAYVRACVRVKPKALGGAGLGACWGPDQRGAGRAAGPRGLVSAGRGVLLPGYGKICGAGRGGAGRGGAGRGGAGRGGAGQAE